MSSGSDPLGPAIRRARLEKLTIYDVTESELKALERGSPDSLFLNFGLVAISVAVSFFIALATTEFKSDRTFIVFVCVAGISTVSCVVLMSLWWRSRNDVAAIFKEIRSRVPPEGVQQPISVTDVLVVRDNIAVVKLPAGTEPPTSLP